MRGEEVEGEARRLTSGSGFNPIFSARSKRSRRLREKGLVGTMSRGEKEAREGLGAPDPAARSKILLRIKHTQDNLDVVQLIAVDCRTKGETEGKEGGGARKPEN